MNIIQKPAHSSNYGVGRSRTVDTIVFHHIVGDAQAAISRFQTPGVEVSSTYVIGSDGAIYQMVAESNTPYTNGNFDWNSRSITIEHAGGHANVPYTEAMYKASIELCRWITSRHNITNFKRHREIVSTACPGGLDVERIVNAAKQGDEMITRDILIWCFGAFFGAYPTEADFKNWVGKNELGNMIYQFERDARRKAYYDSVQKGFACLKTPPTGVNKEAVLKYVQEKLT